MTTKPMYKLTVLLGLVSWIAALAVLAADKPRDTRCYELRTYYAAPGKLDALNARFRNHTMQIFEKHGMVNIGYWVPADNPENKLIYVLAFPSRDAAKKSWADFSKDPDWQKVISESEASGRLVTKVDSVYLSATDYSPEIKPAKAAAPRLFELRTYTAAPGKLDDLHARFRDHTCKLFEKHGMARREISLPGADRLFAYEIGPSPESDPPIPPPGRSRSPPVWGDNGASRPDRARSFVRPSRR